MQFVKTSVLKSQDGVYSRELLQDKRNIQQQAIGDLDYFSSKDTFVTEKIVTLRQINSAEAEERRVIQEQRVSRAQCKASDRGEQADSGDDEGLQEFGPASVTLDEFDFVEAQTSLRRKREAEAERDVASFISQKSTGRVRHRADSLCDSIARAQQLQRRSDSGSDLVPSASSFNKVKAKIKIVKRQRQRPNETSPCYSEANVPNTYDSVPNNDVPYSSVSHHSRTVPISGQSVPISGQSVPISGQSVPNIKRQRGQFQWKSLWDELLPNSSDVNVQTSDDVSVTAEVKEVSFLCKAEEMRVED